MSLKNEIRNQFTDLLIDVWKMKTWLQERFPVQSKATPLKCDQLFITLKGSEIINQIFKKKIIDWLCFKLRLY